MKFDSANEPHPADFPNTHESKFVPQSKLIYFENFY